MKSNKFSKKNLDDETADLIDSKYPAELDVDRIFKKSYQGFLRANVSSDTEDEKFPETIVESSPVEVIQHEHRFAFFTLSKVCAVLCGVMAITAFYALLPDRDIETPDDINKIPIITDNNNNTSTAPSNSATAETTKITTTAYPAVTTNTTAVITTETSVITTLENTVTEPVISNTEHIEKTTEFQGNETEVIPDSPITTTITITTAPSVPVIAEKTETTTYSAGTVKMATKTSVMTSSESTVTESVIIKTEPVEETTEIQPEETTEIQTETTTTTIAATTQSETTTSPPQTTEPKNYGSFEYTVYETGDKWSELKYNRNPDIPIENVNYAFELDGYEMKIYRDDQFSKNLNITETASGNHFDFVIAPYEFYGRSLDPKLEYIIEMTEIDGKPAAVSRRAGDEEGVCTLHWDNGGSICSITGFFAHLEQMRYIAENIR